MNPLEALKQKLKIKPNVQERQKVAVVIKGDKAPTYQQKINKPIVPINEKKPEKDEQEEDEENPLSQQITEHILKEKEREKEPKRIGGPEIVDETNLGFDREALLKKLKEGKMTKVTVKPMLEMSESAKIIEPIASIAPPKIQPTNKKAKKVVIKTPLIIEDSDEEEQTNIKPPLEKAEEEIQSLPIIVPKKSKRVTEKVKKGVAILGPETIVEIGDTDLMSRVPRKLPPINIKVSSYYMNNREIFVNFINSVFNPYKIELERNKESISCDTIGNTSSDFSLLTHQQIVRDYMNLYTPYRGLLLYHGLGSGKTCTSIAIAEGMKDSKKIVIMTPASLRANYIEELKKCGDLLYKRNQFWEWISTDEHPEAAEPISGVLNLPLEYIRKQRGAWFINIKKRSNYDDLSDSDKNVLESQLNEMIKQKYTFINYNGLRTKKLSELTNEFSKNLFDDSVVIIDEGHNLISRIVNKIKKEREIPENKKGEKEHLPLNLATKLYEYLLSAKNARIIVLSGTPVINYANEFSILFNILRGYIKTWQLTLNVKTTKKIDKETLKEMLIGEKTLDYLDYSPHSKILTITRNPFGFNNKRNHDSEYNGVFNSNEDKFGKGRIIADSSDDDERFERKIISILRQNDIEVLPDSIEIKHQKALPDKLDDFISRYIDRVSLKLQNVDSLKRRILGLSSYFRSAQESLLPKYNKTLGDDYHIIRIPMSDLQFKMYAGARKEERKTEKPVKQNSDVLKTEQASTYRIFSRLYCNYVLPDRPMPMKSKKSGEEKIELVFEEEEELEEEEEEEEEQERKKEKKEGKQKKKAEDSEMQKLLKEARRLEGRIDLENDNEGEVEGDEILNNIGGIDYKTRLDAALKNIENNSNDFLTPEALQTYSPKFLYMLENIKDEEYAGLHLVYSQFRTMEGIGLFSLVLEKNGFARFKIKKNSSGVWKIDIDEINRGKPTYALYTGTETSEEKELLRHIYNGEWDQIPENISIELNKIANNNNLGEVIKVFMITSSGSEGINLRNTRYVHIMEPYWHPVRSEQVIGRARRICSHKSLPKELQTVEVFVYLMIFTPEQLASGDAIELKRKDLSKIAPKVPFTSDQYLYEISEIKLNLTNQLTSAIKESAFDCYIYSNGKCVNFGDPDNKSFTYVPDYAKQQSDTIAKENKVAIEWVGKPITLNGVDYVYQRISKTVLNIYDKASYESAMRDPSNSPLQIGTLKTNANGEMVFELLVT